MMSETLGKIGFWMIFLGFQLTFFPMHFAGMLGMPRRVYTYPAGLGLELPNLLSSIGAFVVAAAVLLFVINGVVSLYRGAIAAPNPWDAATLEWATTSPPPVYNFEHIPVVESRTPLWDQQGEFPVVTGLRVDDKEMLLTTVVAAVPDLREPCPKPSLWPFIAAMRHRGRVHCVDLLAVGHSIRRHPGRDRAHRLVLAERHEASSRAGDLMIREVRFTDSVADLPTHKFGPSSLTWWGIIGFMVIEGAAFGLTFAAYFFLMGHEQGWPPVGRAAPGLLAGTLFTIIILLSEIPEHDDQEGRQRGGRADDPRADAGDGWRRRRPARHPRLRIQQPQRAAGPTMPTARSSGHCCSSTRPTS